MDFTFSKHKKLLKTLIKQGFSFITFSDYLQNESQVTLKKTIILRHDVEKRYKNALHLAQIQHQLGIKGTYFFRLLPNSFHPEIVIEISNLGHEIGYHYDDLTKCKGNLSKAISRFEENLKTLRKIVQIQTICMDGSPLSSYDNKNIWKKYQYKDYGILGEPYFDLDFNKVFYLTDTGRRWDGDLFNIRDKATIGKPITNADFLKLNFHSTKDIIRSVSTDSFPQLTMINFHPQRWNNNFSLWLWELLWQNVKNQGKRILNIIRR